MDNDKRILPAGWAERLGLNGRLYYYSKQSQIVQILPPTEVWRCTHNLPYGWEMAIDYDNKNYYINHITQTVTYEDPRTEDDQSSNGDWQLHTSPENLISPQPRECEIDRDSELGFGFIAGSEKPVIIRSVTPGGPSVGKLLPDDQIVKIGTENVMMAEREHVIELIREKTDSVLLTVLQPNRSANSSFLNPAKKVCRTMERPKVRFADDVIVSGQERTEGSSPLLLSPGVLRIELENNQIKSFQFLPETTAGEAVAALCDKLGFKDPNLFSLVLKQPYDNETQNEKTSKSSLRGSMSSDQTPVSSSSTDSLLVAPWDCLSKVVNNPAFRQHSCHFRLEFMPTDFHKLARNDPEAFRYLYVQCVNDVVSGEVYRGDLSRDEILRLACIQMQELVLSSIPTSPPPTVEKNQKYSGSNETPTQRGVFRFASMNNKLTLKYVEKEYGLRRFLPPSIVSTMQRDNPTTRNVRKSIQQHLKAYANASVFTPYPASPGIPYQIASQSRNKEVTLLQLRLQYLKILSPQHLFGGRYFSASMQALMESDITVLVGHHYGISQMINSKTKMVSVLAEFHHVNSFEVSSCQAESNTTTVRIEFAEKQELLLSMEPQAAHNLAFMVSGYCRVYGNTDMVLTLPISESTSAPMYFGPHKVKPSHWNYPPVSKFQPRRNSVTDVSLPLDYSSPSYFYCDFSEPITPAVLSQEAPLSDTKQINGVHTSSSPPPEQNMNENRFPEAEYENDEMDGHAFAKSKHENSDTNNNTSFASNPQDVTYEEIPNSDSVSESPRSSLSAGQFSDLSTSNSPQFRNGVPPSDADDLPTSDGYLIPTPPAQRSNRGFVDVEQTKDSSESEGDWMDLMKALGTEKSKNETVLKENSDPSNTKTVLPPPPLTEVSAEDKGLRNIIVPPPPDYPPPKIARNESVKRNDLSQRLKMRSCSLRSQNSDNNDIQQSHRMSSFKPSEEELKVFSLTRNVRTVTEFADLESHPSSPDPSNDEHDDVRDPVTRKKLQETEDLIQYFRQRREEVDSRDKTSNQSPETSQEFGSNEIHTPVVLPDIAAGNKRLRKADKAASRNRKSWAGNESPLLGKLDVIDQRPMSMSNPDLSLTPSQKKRNKSLLRRIFGEKKNRSHSMYNTSGSSQFETAYGGRKKRRFWLRTPKFRLRRAFTWSSSKKENRKSVIPTSDEGTSNPKSRNFRFRPFSKKSKSTGILIISEPCDEVRGVDLLPSGKYTVAGTMFQVMGDTKESEIVTVENGSKRGSVDDITSENFEDNEKETNKSIPESIDVNELLDEKILRENSSRKTSRPLSFSTFQQSIDDVSTTLTLMDESRRNSLQNEIDQQQPSPCELSLTESSEHLQELRDAATRINALADERSLTLPPGLLSSSVSFQDSESPRAQKQHPVKPMRKLIPVNSPIVPPDVAQKSASLPPHTSGLNDPNATSTPINTTMSKKRSQKRPAPPPPTQLAKIESIENTHDVTSLNDKFSDDDVFSEPECFSEHSLVNEIFSYLQHSNIGKEKPLNPATNDNITSGSESALPYDDDYLMPGLKTNGIEGDMSEQQSDSTDEKRQRTMFEMFYDEMIADNAKLTLGDDDETSSVDSDDSQSEGSKHASYDVTYDDVALDDVTKSNAVVLISYQDDQKHHIYHNDDNELMTSSEDSTNSSDVIVSSPAITGSPISSPDYQNLHSQSGNDSLSGRRFFSYHHLISPHGYDKARPNALKKKPPLPPKPIFH